MSALSNLEVQITNDHLNKMLKLKPIRAISELIWNALDADATMIDIVFERNLLEGLEHIIIKDNGHGIQFDFVDQFFGKLGDSHKVKDKASPNGRKYHGKLGQGRYSGFVLGRSVEWVSVIEQEGELYEFSISGHDRNLKVFGKTSLTKAISPFTGTIVSITELIDDSACKISNKLILAQDLTMVFAPYLLAYKDISITVEGLKLEPEKQIVTTHDFPLFQQNKESELVRGSLKVIEWKLGSHRNLYLCGQTGIAFEEETTGIKSGSFSHTAYLISNVIDDLWETNQIDVRTLHPDYIVLRETAETTLRDLYRQKLVNEASHEIKILKNDRIYPYKGEAQTVVEEAERQVFDICAVKINQYLPDFNKVAKSSREFTYRLMKEALQSNPDSLRLILKEVLKLPPEQQDELASILGKTSLESIINTTKLISNRLLFLNGIEQILYGEDFHKKLKERSQLHKILLRELWLFGEQYSYGYDDISLKNVLKKHLSILKRDEISPEIDYKKITTLDDIPDIGLYRQYKYGREDCYENLIIELKRPSCVVGTEEISQVKRYAHAIEKNVHFDKTKTKWKVVLIGIKLDDEARFESSQGDREAGLIYKNKTGNMEVWLKEWNEVIQEAKGKHQFLKERLELEVKDNEEGLQYLRTKYKEYIPE
ncbi:hypothetical protein PAECIP111892_03618 [Paenibacillus auburnensis]|uniref:DNA mismatch repair protein n=1 Tax=Paenibacillus auburnensis TaxID=2905649 RepID=A0ABM9CGT2_9BACL|nr:ATP-binding protein [Paenibacillus auburnensis]CAH1211664.1 hypothetical protein PAECIP111892_03618 [Paenibacillus auburnensis]